MENVFHIDFISVFLIILYSSFLWFVLLLILRKVKLLSYNTIIFTALIFIFYWTIFFIDNTLNLKTIPPDTEVYARIITNFNKYFAENSFAVKSFSILNYLFFKACFGRPLVFVVFNIFYYQLAIIFIFLSFREFLKTLNVQATQKHFLITQFLAVLYPVSIINTPSLLREPMHLMFFSATLFYVSKIYYHKKLKKNYVVLCLMLLTGTFLTRPITGVSLIIIFLLVVLIIKKMLSIKKMLRLFLALLIAGVLINKLVLTVYNLEFSLAWVEKYRALKNIEYANEGYGNLILDEFPRGLFNLFVLLLQYLLSPFPILIPSNIAAQKLIPLLDSLFIITVIFTPLILFYKKKFNKVVILFFIVAFLPSIFESNITGAYRHRMTAIFVLLPLIGYLIGKVKLRFR